jgi:hypothetical protein
LKIKEYLIINPELIMKKIEIVKRTVYFCDVCGEEIKGNKVTYNEGTENETHACLDFNEHLGNTCSEELESRLKTNLANLTAELEKIKCKCGNPWKISKRSSEYSGEIVLHCTHCNDWYFNAQDHFSKEDLDTLVVING